MIRSVRGGADALEEVTNELLTFVRKADGTPEAQAVLSDNLASKEAKKKLVVALGRSSRHRGRRTSFERIGSEPVVTMPLASLMNSWKSSSRDRTVTSQR